jgi:hypothetical protein
LFIYMNSMGGVMVSVLTSGALDRGFEPWLGQTKDYKIGIYFQNLFSIKKKEQRLVCSVLG